MLVLQDGGTGQGSAAVGGNSPRLRDDVGGLFGLAYQIWTALR